MRYITVVYLCVMAAMLYCDAQQRFLVINRNGRCIYV